MRAIAKAVVLLFVHFTAGGDTTLGNKLKTAIDHSWLAYRIEKPRAHQRLCCAPGSGVQQDGANGCDLNGPWWFRGWTSREVSQDDVFVYLRVKSGKVDGMLLFDATCPVNIGNVKVEKLDGISAADSVSFFGSLEDTTQWNETPLQVLALHDSPQALAAMQRIATNPKRRARGWFWLARTGADGIRERLELAARSDEALRTRLDAAGALAQLPGKASVESLEKLVTDKTLPKKLRQHALVMLSHSVEDSALATFERLLFGSK
jgi:hypothetical protein